MIRFTKNYLVDRTASDRLLSMLRGEAPNTQTRSQRLREAAAFTGRIPIAARSWSAQHVGR